ncbi:hypothetical protein [Streptomyces sp. KL118A]|uniref:hypothetical protein n=1 Tax=Streptomyces sp. KL118A TaxID=3045153 RepID=UPI00278C78D6|nr:hypothetical protein [Streptomyces sp. KL118A]
MSMTQEFTHEQASQLLSGTSFLDDPSERVCPACRSRSIRVYVYRHRAGARASLITYAWCAACRRFKGWTGPDLGDLEFTDPLSRHTEERSQAQREDFDGFLRRLDVLWDTGELPQEFSRT